MNLLLLCWVTCVFSHVALAQPTLAGARRRSLSEPVYNEHVVTSIPQGTALSIFNKTITTNISFSWDVSNDSLADAIILAAGVNATAPGAQLILEKVEIRLSCSELLHMQTAACSVNSGPDVQVLPASVHIDQLATDKLTARDVSITAPDCKLGGAVGSSSINTTASISALNGATGNNYSSNSTAGVPAPPCLSLPVSNWSQVRQAVAQLQPLTASLRLVLTANMTIEPACASCVTATTGRQPTGSPMFSSKCTCSEDGLPSKLRVYRNLTLYGGSRNQQRVILDIDFQEGCISLDVDAGGSMLLENLTLMKLPVGPVTLFARAIYTTYMWFVSFMRCAQPTGSLTVRNSTLVASDAEYTYMIYWLRRAASSNVEDQSSSAWLFTMDCGSLGVRPAVSRWSVGENGTYVAMYERGFPGATVYDSILTSPLSLGHPSYPAILAYPSLFLDPWHPLPYAHYVCDVASLLQVLKAPRYKDVILVANISIPPEALPAGGIDIPNELYIHGWPGRPTVLDMQRASGVFRITQRVVLHNLWLMNTGVAPAGTYPELWVNNTMLWSFGFDRRNPLLELRACTVVVSLAEAKYFSTSASPEPTWGYYQFDSYTATSLTFKTLVTVTGITGYDITMTNVSVAFPNLPVPVEPQLPGRAKYMPSPPPSPPSPQPPPHPTSALASAPTSLEGLGMHLGVSLGAAFAAALAVVVALGVWRQCHAQTSNTADGPKQGTRGFMAGQWLVNWSQASRAAPACNAQNAQDQVDLTVVVGSSQERHGVGQLQQQPPRPPFHHDAFPGHRSSSAGTLRTRSNPLPHMHNAQSLCTDSSSAHRPGDGALATADLLHNRAFPTRPPAPGSDATGARGLRRPPPLALPGNGGRAADEWDSSDDSYDDPDDPFLAPCDSHSLLINQAGMSRDLQQQLAATGNGGLAERLHTMVARMQEELGNEEVVLERVVGQGASGVVYEGQWRGMRVACKTVTFTRVADQPISRKLHSAMNEVAVCRSLQHNNIVNAFGYHLVPLQPAMSSASNNSKSWAVASSRDGTSSGPGTPKSIDAGHLDYRLVLIQEFCEGGTLRDAIDGARFMERRSGNMARPWADKERPLQPQPSGEAFSRLGPPRPESPVLVLNAAAVVQLATDIAAGMSHIHSRNIIHSDLSSANILLKTCEYSPSHFVAKVADFGLALKLSGGKGHVSNMQRGTWHYIAPEVVGVGRMSKAADVYSFGVVLHEMWHGTPAWRRKGYTGDVEGEPVHMDQASNNAFREAAPLMISSDCHEGIKDLIISCTQYNPADRPTFFTIVERLMEIQRQLAMDVSSTLLPGGLKARPFAGDMLSSGIAADTADGSSSTGPCSEDSPTPSPALQLNPGSRSLTPTSSTRALHVRAASTHLSSNPSLQSTMTTVGPPELDPGVVSRVQAMQLELVGLTTGVVRSEVNESVLARKVKQAEGDIVRTLSAAWEREAMWFLEQQGGVADSNVVAQQAQGAEGS